MISIGGCERYNVFDLDAAAADAATCPTLSTDGIAWSSPRKTLVPTRRLLVSIRAMRATGRRREEATARLRRSNAGPLTRAALVHWSRIARLDVDPLHDEFISASNTNCGRLPAPTISMGPSPRRLDCPPPRCGRTTRRYSGVPLQRRRLRRRRLVCRESIAGPADDGRSAARHPARNAASATRPRRQRRPLGQPARLEQHATRPDIECRQVPRTPVLRNWTSPASTTSPELAATGDPGASADRTIKASKVTCSGSTRRQRAFCNRGTSRRNRLPSR